ncbi:MAG: SDR family NAD(P)-dependent oxidoreductase [Rhodospirillales bacterium]
MTWRVAWVTGAGQGIGRALALRLASEGCRVAISARTEQDLLDVAAEGRRKGFDLLPFPLDVTDEGAVARTAAAIEEALGPLDLAVFNAGTHIPMRADAFVVDDVRRLVDVNLMGVVHGLAAVLPRFLARRRGQIAVVSSVSGYCGLPTAAAYGATKAALINMCEALKPELDAHDVVLSIVNPGFVRTPLTDKNRFPMPFLMEADDAARRIMKGMQTRRFEIAFPRRLVWLMKTMRLLPYPLYFALTRRLVAGD